MLVFTVTHMRKFDAEHASSWEMAGEMCLILLGGFTAWLISVGCAVVMAVTIPHPPFLILYPLFIAGCGMMAWAAWTRRSFGMLANYVLLVTIDTVGLTRLLLS